MHAVVVSPDGRQVVTGSEDTTAAVWDLDTGQRLHELAGHRGSVYAVAVSPDGRQVVTGSADQSVAVWDLRTRQPLTRVSLDGSVRCWPGLRTVILSLWEMTLAISIVLSIASGEPTGMTSRAGRAAGGQVLGPGFASDKAG